MFALSGRCIRPSCGTNAMLFGGRIAKTDAYVDVLNNAPNAHESYVYTPHPQTAIRFTILCLECKSTIESYTFSCKSGKILENADIVKMTNPILIF